MINQTTKIIRIIFILILILGAIPFSIAAKTPNHLILKPESKLWLTGDSTLHAYKSEATEIIVSAEGGKRLLRKFDVEVSVKGLKSGKKTLDKKMIKLLLADENPSVHFHLISYKAPLASQKINFPIEVIGNLSLAGVTRTVSLEGQVEVQERGFHIQGETSLLMTDFGIEPPTMLAGALKTDDQVIVHYDIFLEFEK